MKYNFNNITKLLDKIFKAGFNTEKDILSIKLKDLSKLPDLTSTDIIILLDLKQAIKNKKIIAFLNGKERNEENEKL